MNIPDEIDVGGLGDEDGNNALESFFRVRNESGASLVLVGADEWTFGTHLWGSACDPEMLEDIDVFVDGDWLAITSDDADKRTDCKIKVLSDEIVDEVKSDGDGDLEHEGVIKGVKTITVNGNGDVDLGVIETEELTLVANGNGNINITDLRAERLTLDVGGNGDVALGGDVAETDASIRGNGELSAMPLTIQDLFIEMSGDGDGTVLVEDVIAGSVTGNGTLHVHGNPDGEVEVDGSGNVVVHPD